MTRDELKTTQTIVDKLGQAVGAIGMVTLVAMLLLTTGDVFLRYTFNRPILGSTEIIQFMMVVFAFSAILWCTAGKKHIHVDILDKYIPAKAISITDIIFYTLYLVIYGFIAWRTFLEALDIWPTSQTIGSVSTVLGIPEYPFYLFIAFTCGIISIMLAVFIVMTIIIEVKKWNLARAL